MAATKEKKPLTEAALLRMPESAYMNEAQLAFFRDRLQQMEREILQNADETTEHLRETVIVPDPADRATIEEEHALELRTRDRERKLLKKIQQALRRLIGTVPRHYHRLGAARRSRCAGWRWPGHSRQCGREVRCAQGAPAA